MANTKREVVIWECENPACEKKGAIGVVGEDSFECPHCGRLVGHFAFIRKERLANEGGLTLRALDAAYAFKSLLAVLSSPR
jgi:hypothetical protein